MATRTRKSGRKIKISAVLSVLTAVGALAVLWFGFVPAVTGQVALAQGDYTTANGTIVGICRTDEFETGGGSAGARQQNSMTTCEWLVASKENLDIEPVHVTRGKAIGEHEGERGDALVADGNRVLAIELEDGTRINAWTVGWWPMIVFGLGTALAVLVSVLLYRLARYGFAPARRSSGSALRDLIPARWTGRAALGCGGVLAVMLLVDWFLL